MSAQEVIFEVNGLKKTYLTPGGLGRQAQSVEAVKGIDFQVLRGETLSIVGESGCGKSTTAKMLLNIEKPTAGQILFHGRDIASYSKADWREYRKKVQVIFQDPYSSLNPRWKVGRIIAEPLKLNTNLSHQQITEKVYEIMAKVGLQKDWYNRYPHQFSGGQRQRIGIARALILNPEVIICDEPVSALDVSIQAQVLNLLLDLQQEFNLTYVFISHDLSVVEHISDRILVMYYGKVVETGTVDDIFENTQHEYTKKLLSAIPSL